MLVNNVESMNYAGTLFSKVKGEAVRQKINFSIFDTNKDGKFSISELESAYEKLKLTQALPKNPAEQPTKDITIKYEKTWFGNFLIYKNGQNKIIKKEEYVKENKLVSSIEYLYDEVGNPLKSIHRNQDHKITKVLEGKDEKGHWQKQIDYASDGKTIASVWEGRDENGNWQKSTDYAADGKTIARVFEGKDKKGHWQKLTSYASDGKTIAMVLEDRDENGNFQKSTDYAADGKTIASVWEGRDKNGNWQKRTNYASDGSIILFDRINNTIKCEYRGTNQYNEFISPDMPKGYKRAIRTLINFISPDTPEEYKQAIRILINNCPSEVKEILRKEKIKIEIVKTDCCDADAHYHSGSNIVKMHINCLYSGTFIHELGHALHYVRNDDKNVHWDMNSLQGNKAYCDAFEREVSEYVNAGNKRFRYGKNIIDNEGAFYGTANEREFFACFYQAYYGYPEEGWTLEMLEKVFPDTTKEARLQLEKLKNLPDSARTRFQ